MDTLKFVRALKGEGRDTEQASIIATEMYRLYAHSVLGGAYKPVDYGDFDTLTLKAKLMTAKTEAMANVLRAMTANESTTMSGTLNASS